MDRQRFNQLLHNPSLVENNDIRQLNEYRKKYPYFQGLYVIVAKALQERNHPKTDAFIKKAAIYSANRAHLKSIIEGEGFFKAEKPLVLTPTSTNTADKENSSSTQTERAQKKTENTERPKEVENKQIEVKEEAQKNKEELKPEPPSRDTEIPKKEEKKELKSDAQVNSDTKETKPEAEPEQTFDKENDPVLDELKATKARIEALLRGELPNQDEPEELTQPEEPQEAIATKPHPLPKKKNQIEIIEKFIADDPQIDIKKKALLESAQHQEDLARKSLEGSESFYTETMAKLLVKQGKVKKGLEIYKKLGLKFPEKSTYFAAQIEKIKSKHNV